MLTARNIIDAAKKYNGSSDMLKSVYGISSSEKLDGFVVAPSWVPEKILAEYEKSITVVAQKAGYSSYIVEFAGKKLGWIKCGVSSSNLIDAMLSLADSNVEPIIFIGAVGAVSPDVPLGEFCTPSASYAFDGASLYLHEKLDAAAFGRMVIPSCQNYIDKTVARALENGIHIAKRPAFCTDSIICEYAHLDEIKATGAELVEMETAAFYECLNIMDKNGIALLCVSDNSAIGAPLVERTPEQRKRYDECRTHDIPEAIRLACEC